MSVDLTLLIPHTILQLLLVVLLVVLSYPTQKDFAVFDIDSIILGIHYKGGLYSVFLHDILMNLLRRDGRIT